MKRLCTADLVTSFIILIFAILILTNLHQIPFHPDEVSLLYQSRDFETLFTDPLSLAYDPNQVGEIDQSYRLMNPPLTKYILALGRLLAGYGPESVSVDWDWSLSWEENQLAGALPDMELLKAARLASSCMVLLSLVFIYLCGKELHSSTLGLLAVFLLGTNALTLLHGRRAMAEGPLLFGITFAIFTMLKGNNRPWLAGLGVAVATCTKLSAGVLLPIALLSIAWTQSKTPTTKIIFRVLIFLLSFTIIYTLLNPVIWVNPFQSLQAQWQERTQFVAEMISKFEERAPEQVLDEPIDRFGALIAQLYILDPQFAEAANYSEATESYEMDYNASFFHSLFRGFFWGGLLLLFTILGIVYWVFELRKESVQLNNQITLLLLSSLALLCALLWAIPLPFQRYYVPLIPPICLWSSLGLILTYQISKQAFFKIRRPVVEH